MSTEPALGTIHSRSPPTRGILVRLGSAHATRPVATSVFHRALTTSPTSKDSYRLLILSSALICASLASTGSLVCLSVASSDARSPPSVLSLTPACSKRAWTLAVLTASLLHGSFLGPRDSMRPSSLRVSRH